MDTPQIIGIAHPIEDERTGATLGFHVLRMYQVDVVTNQTLLTLSSFVSQAAYSAGKTLITSISVGGIAGKPEGDPVQWGYQTILAAPAESVWSGAQAVHAAQPDEVAE